MEPDRQVDAEADISGRQRAGDQLALTADIENAGGEADAPRPSPRVISGVAATRVSEIGVNTAFQPVPVEMACWMADGLMIEPVKRAP